MIVIINKTSINYNIHIYIFKFQMPILNKKNSHRISQTIIMLIIMLAIVPTIQYSSPSSCNSTAFYNYLSHACVGCPTNTDVSALDKTYCNCSVSQYANPDSIGFMSSDACLPISGSNLTTNQAAVVYERDGTKKTTVSAVTCVDSYPNVDRTMCIPCGIGMTYDTTLKLCKCSTNNYFPVNGFCMTNPSFSVSLTDLNDQLLYGIAYMGCTTFNKGTQACQILMNKCAQRKFAEGDPFCSLLNNRISAGAINKYMGAQQALNESIGIYASSVSGTDSATVKNKLSFMVLQYNSFGELRDIKPFGTDQLPCIATQEDAIKFQSFGLNLIKKCSAADLQASTPYFYDVYVINSDSNYMEVFTNYGSSAYYKRFHRNGYTSTSMAFRSTPPLTVPYLNLTSSDPPQISTTSTSDVINLTLTAPFIVFNVAILFVFVVNFYKYMKYNPDQNNDPYFFFKALLLFLLMAIKHWGIGLWIWLFGVSMYCFCFYKFQQTVYLLLPDIFTQWFQYYDPFMIVFYLQFGFMFASVFLLIYDLGSTTDFFLIDWEKQKNMSNYDINTGGAKRPISIWRKILLINQLYQLSVSQITNKYFTVLFGLLFLDGLKWINLSYQIPNVNKLQNQSTSISNVVLAYFIITFIFFIIFIGQYILKYAIKTWRPLPHQNFIDLCCISNYSIIIFDHALHGYYIHGMNPLGKAQGTLAYIQSIFQKQAKSFGKSRAFKNDDPDQTQTFEILFPIEVRNAFQMKYKTRYLQKLVGRAMDTSVLAKPIPDMLNDEDYHELDTINNDMLTTFKYYLEGVKTSRFNVLQRPILQKFINCPLDLEYITNLPIFFKDHWNQFTQVFLSGHQFVLVINLINFINIFYIATKSVTIASLIALIICQIFIKAIADESIKRNISKNTLIDDKFFN